MKELTQAIHKKTDILNKADSGGGNEYFCNINLGKVSSPVSVHANFKLGVYISAEKVQTAPLPFLNRFSKFALSFHDALQDRVEYYMQPENMPLCFASENSSNIQSFFSQTFSSSASIDLAP